MEQTNHETALKSAKELNYRHQTHEGINWNRITDMIDKMTWDKLTSQFWLDTRMPVANDLPDWRNLSQEEKTLFNKVFGGLTLLDTLQGESGVGSFMESARTKHEFAVYTNIQFMEEVHAKSYSTIFSTFNTPSEIDEIFEWVKTNKYLQYKANKIREIYETMPLIYRKAASVLLESFLFYSGFYTPLRYLGESKMMNTAEIIQLIIRDESVHGTYIGTKFRADMEEKNKEEQEAIKTWIYELAMDLWSNELGYTKELYASVGYVEQVNTFLEYNLNKSLDNLGLSPLFQTTAADVDPLVMNGISTTTGNHDFFSSVGNGYLLGNVETITVEDYNMIDELAGV
ncbi:class 1b ribonucleoside-diphosphate reductase subunit beta [Enterococcus mundtii]|uniref:class 1b ribonucleoside-diphosphate reductase subunit beta n=1 Tax=Enterococcus mundtii TaxID=53346 RepID=UPI001A9698D2|nr:class 1b ribonucleoside-diphosphate reductase subunit beta [Enterococcus mundtii]MBO1087215.1 class 1b ribonucleoside-diphosphate reductase subunit beta [Enterococcus mundtii]